VINTTGMSHLKVIFVLSRDNPSPTSMRNKERNILKVCVKYSNPLNTFRQNKHIFYTRLQIMSCILFITKLPVSLLELLYTIKIKQCTSTHSVKLHRYTKTRVCKNRSSNLQTCAVEGNGTIFWRSRFKYFTALAWHVARHWRNRRLCTVECYRC
jgi:hypothetical protein